MDFHHQTQASFNQIEEVVSTIQEGSTVAIGGFWFVRIPVALIEALVKKGVKNLTVVSHCSGLALEPLIAAGLVKKVIFSFSSMDLFGLSPFLRKSIEKGEIEWEEWTALRMTQALEAGRQNLPALLMKPPLDSDLNEMTEDYSITFCPFTGERLGITRALIPDFSLIHAQKADEMGNIQILGSLGMDRLLVGAAKQTVVSVEEIVPVGSFEPDPRGTIIPRFLVNRICPVKGGAYPSSCLPYYVTDYWKLSECMEKVKIGDKFEALQKPSNESLNQRLDHLKRFTEVKSVDYEKALLNVKKEEINPQDYTMDELMACILAEQVNDRIVSTVGSNTPLAFVAYLLAKKTHAPNAVLIPYTGLNDIPFSPVTLTLAESFAYQMSNSHWGIEDLWQWLYQKSLVSIEFGSTAQIDQYGQINNSMIRTAENRIKVRLPGQAGLADVINFHHHSLFYITRQDCKRLVEKVDFVSGVRHFLTKDERQKVRLGYGDMRVLTNYGIFELDKLKRRLILTHIHPGIELRQVQENTGFVLEVSDNLELTKKPTKEQLELIRNVIDPFGFRKLEFLTGQARMDLIKDILEKEQNVLFGKPLISFTEMKTEK